MGSLHSPLLAGSAVGRDSIGWPHGSLAMPAYAASASEPAMLWISRTNWRGRRRFSTQRLAGASRRGTARALQGGGRAPRRLVDVIQAVPRASRAYFKSPLRRSLYGGIALLGGFYIAQTISLTFGALGINDVIAAGVCVLFVEYATKFYHTRPRITFPVALLNNFKMGFTYGLFIDAFKLAS